MLQELSCILAIIGMVVGSGFISGKEVVVFFSRFGSWSFLSIFLAFFVLFFLFKCILNYASSAREKLKCSKFAAISNIILCTIFSAAMLGGVNNLLKCSAKWLNFAVFCVILLICVFIFKKGNMFFNKINLFLVPTMLVIFVGFLLSKLSFAPSCHVSFGSVSMFYAILYCILNTSNGCALLCNIGENLAKKQKVRVAFISALALCLLLLAANIVLLARPSSFDCDMPLLSIFSGVSKICMIFVVGLGCATTLFSLVYSSSQSCRGLFKNEFLNFFISICVPCIVSLLGFSNLVQYLYPLASILGGGLLVWLFFIPSLKRAYNKVHSCRKNAKNENAGHNNVKF